MASPSSSLTAAASRRPWWSVREAFLLPPGSTSPGTDEQERGSEDRAPVVLHADDGPVVAGRLLQGLLGPGGVAELAGGVVVQDQQPQERLVGVPGELEHKPVAVGIPSREQRPPADPAPDADGLLWTCFQVVRQGGVRDPAALCVAGITPGGGAADHPLTGN